MGKTAYTVSRRIGVITGTICCPMRWLHGTGAAMGYKKHRFENRTGNLKWRRQCICLRRSWLEVCRVIYRLGKRF